MPARRKYEEVKCEFYTWRVYQRHKVYYADGRGNSPDLGRHSLAALTRHEAINNLYKLDRVQAERFGLIPAGAKQTTNSVLMSPVTISEGRAAYEAHLNRPAFSGGVRPSTFKRYRTVLDKFETYCQREAINTWDSVDRKVLEAYGGILESKGYKRKTITNELTTLKQLFRFLVDEEKLPGREPIRLPVKSADSKPAYCWKPEEVAAMVEHCRNSTDLSWLYHVIVMLAHTGLRISELASLRWRDIDLESRVIKLVDETGHVSGAGEGRTLKSGRSRSLPIHPTLLPLLKGLRRRGPYVLYGPRGGKLKPDTVGRRFKEDVVRPLSGKFSRDDHKEGFARGTCHSFRHYFISTCANRGVAIMVVMDWVGHADSGMVRRYYHLHDAESKRQMDSVEFVETESATLPDESQQEFLHEENTSDAEEEPDSDA